MAQSMFPSKQASFLIALNMTLIAMGYVIYQMFIVSHQPAKPLVTKLPPAPSYAWFPSPHFSERPAGAKIDTIILHATALSPLSRVIAFFQLPASKVSAHFTISKKGRVVQHVKVKDEAWHAGPSLLPDGRTSANDFSIGIELVNENDGNDPYPKAQITALKELVKALSTEYPIQMVYTHSEVSDPPERKSDPKGFDMNSFRSWWEKLFLN